MTTTFLVSQSPDIVNFSIDSSLLNDAQYERLLSIFLKRRLSNLKSMETNEYKVIKPVKEDVNDIIDSMDISIYVSLRHYTTADGKNLCYLLAEDITWNLFRKGYVKVLLKEILNIVNEFYNKYEKLN